MEKKQFISKILILLTLIFTSCNIDDVKSTYKLQEKIPDTFSEYYGNEISRDFIGTVIDKNKIPIGGVIINIGSETTITDNNGVFIIRNADVRKRFGYIRAEKAGYINGSRSIVPSNGTNKITIMLLENNVVGTVNSGTSETISLSNGSSVSFDGNFIKEDGSAYFGSVDVVMHYLDPTDEDLAIQMPGMLYAQNQEGAERMLQTLGMLAVELKGSGGKDLNLALGSTSEIKIPVNPSLMNIAPPTIPLWYFDEDNGYWKEEGQATLQGNMYVGNVSHFSFWNCDIQTEAIRLCVTVIDEDGNKLNNATVKISSSNFGTNYGYTNEEGEVCGLVPSNENLELNIYNYDLYDISLHTQILEPLNTDSNISVTVPNNSNIISETVIGTVTDCNGNNISNGYLQLISGNQIFSNITNNGEFKFSFHRHLDNNTFNIKGIDYLNAQETGEITYSLTTPLTNIGNLIACSTSSVEFFQFTDSETGENYVFDNVDAYTTQNVYLSIEASNNTDGLNTNCVSLNFAINNINGVVGNYTLGPENQYGWFGCSNLTSSDYYLQYHNLNISNFGDVGEYIDINFSGFYTLEGIVEELTPMTGTIHALRSE